MHLSFLLDRLFLRKGEFLSAPAIFADTLIGDILDLLRICGQGQRGTPFRKTMLRISTRELTTGVILYVTV